MGLTDNRISQTDGGGGFSVETPRFGRLTVGMGCRPLWVWVCSFGGDGGGWQREIVVLWVVQVQGDLSIHQCNARVKEV